MAFINDGTNVVSFAEFQDVVALDQRLFEANEGLTDDIVEAFLIRSTERILNLIRSTQWWKELYIQKTPGATYTSAVDLPQVDPNKILGRQNDFTDLCAMYALWNYILPKVADFSKEDNSERNKIGFYQAKYQILFDELINSGDWYDISGDDVVSRNEKLLGNNNLKRIR